MRTRKSLFNICVTLICYFVTLIVGFISRYFFIKYLGQEYLGINSLFSNIISVMSVVELGFGTAVIYNLYKPISIGDEETIISIMSFYKKVYRIIAGVIFIIGLIILPFIGIIVGDTSVRHLHFYFFLYILDASVSYLLTYKRSIYYADQKNYIINTIHTFLYALVFICQISLLYLTHSFLIYILIQIAFRISENMIISLKVDKSYPYLKTKTVEPLDSAIKQDITLKIKGLFFHQIGSAIVLGTDNIIISMTKSLGIIAVGIYSNYILITTYLNQIIAQIFSAVTSSVGNLLVEKEKEETYIVYKRILFLNALLYNFVCVSIGCIMEPFIDVWLGKEFLLPSSVLVVITLNFYIQGMKRTCGMFKEAAGIFYEDRYVPVIESVINLVSSVFFVKQIGLAGVCLGTIISSMIHWLYSYPVYVYKYIFNKDIKQYILDYIFYVVIFALSYLISYRTYSEFAKTEPIFNFLESVLICVVIPNIIFIIAFFRKPEYRYWRNMIVLQVEKVRKY